jgi:glycine/D-amino acid oxidase-like deaminating enzyme
MVVERAAHLHPALYFKGLLDKAVSAGAKIASRTELLDLSQNSDLSWDVKTARGLIKADHVIIATNGYTGKATPKLQRRVVPLGSYIIATEELPAGMAEALSPRNRSFADTRRILTYYRLSPDGKRMIFGGRAKFGATDPMQTAPMLYRFMIDRFPEMKGVKITNSWTGNVAFTLDELPHMGKFEGLHYALGCNGSGVAMMSYLGHQTARKVLSSSNRACAFDREEFPSHPLYNGSTWFLPYVGTYFRVRDWMDRKFK